MLLCRQVSVKMWTQQSDFQSCFVRVNRLDINQEQPEIQNWAPVMDLSGLDQKWKGVLGSDLPKRIYCC